jgi:hypothetical protein
VSARAHWGEYLPDWHTWEDYRISYAARRDLGGGALLTMCHPFDYLRWLLGEVDSVWARSGRSGALELDVEDVAEVSLGFVSGAIGSVHLDYLQRPPTHTLEIIGEAGTIRWDALDGAARLYRSSSDAWVVDSPPVGYDRNAMFLEEMRHFRRVVGREEPSACTLEDGVVALQIALEAKRHSRQTVRPTRTTPGALAQSLLVGDPGSLFLERGKGWGAGVASWAAPLALVWVLVFAARYLYLNRFGLYEDDITFIPPALPMAAKRAPGSIIRNCPIAVPVLVWARTGPAASRPIATMIA